jgi:hypothetical protein
VRACNDCGIRGYSRELCTVHIRRQRRHPEPVRIPRPLTFGARVLGGLALGAGAGLLVATAASFVIGAAALAPAFLLKVVGAKALIGGFWGTSRAIAARRARGDRRATTESSNPRRGRAL